MCGELLLGKSHFGPTGSNHLAILASDALFNIILLGEQLHHSVYVERTPATILPQIGGSFVKAYYLAVIDIVDACGYNYVLATNVL